MSIASTRQGVMSILFKNVDIRASSLSINSVFERVRNQLLKLRIIMGKRLIGREWVVNLPFSNTARNTRKVFSNNGFSFW